MQKGDQRQFGDDKAIFFDMDRSHHADFGQAKPTYMPDVDNKGFTPTTRICVLKQGSSFCRAHPYEYGNLYMQGHPTGKCNNETDVP
ncbi:hypothetical protein GOP47_0023982 [Adiantum capillus-veneris]|uniref:Uncharacterized protein n=1 Tax=Adiantum capillus-veneris TaxID=13818 RepID=A0A9D4Z5P8_ADICA|nr:hypothetical protein GOP47_0023982 [Adiantum capillus-veneris]